MYFGDKSEVGALVAAKRGAKAVWQEVEVRSVGREGRQGRRRLITDDGEATKESLSH